MVGEEPFGSLAIYLHGVPIDLLGRSKGDVLLPACTLELNACWMDGSSRSHVPRASRSAEARIMSFQIRFIRSDWTSASGW